MKKMTEISKKKELGKISLSYYSLVDNNGTQSNQSRSEGLTNS